MQKYEQRQDVPHKYKWDLSSFYKSDEEFDKEFEVASGLNSKIEKYKGCVKDSEKLFEFLEEDLNLSTILENMYVYSYLKNDEMLGVSSSIERKNKVELLMMRHSLNVSFFEPELLALTNDEYNELFNNKKLLKYKPALDDIYRYKKHILSEKEEQMIESLTSATNHFNDMSSLMLNSLNEYGKVTVDGKEEIITTTNYRKLMKNDNREKRKEIREKFSKVLKQYSALSAMYLDSYVKLHKEENKLRNYPSCFEAKLFSLNMPKEAYESLVKNVEQNADLYQKYLRLFKEVHNLDELRPYDLSLELTKNNKEYTVEEAKELCLNAIKPLGEEYYQKFKKIFDNNYIDFMGYKGKYSGGYSYSTSTNDSRILMSYNYDLESVSTIIHEGGHNVHHQFVKENNFTIYRDEPSITAEVASLTNECLLSNYLMNNGKTKHERLSGIANMISVINSNLFGAVREGKIEQDFYEYVERGNTLTDSYLNDLNGKSLKKYYGNVVKDDEYSSLGWITRSHYYMFFYLYAYAFSISIATYVASEIINGNNDMINKYIKFLSIGTDMYPYDIIKTLGIDLKEDKVYQKALKYYDNLLDEFDKIRKEE